MKLNNETLPSPTGIGVVLEEPVTASARTADGTLLAGAGITKRRITVRWRVMTGPALAGLLAAAQGRFVGLSFPDPMSGGETEATVRLMRTEIGGLLQRGGERLWTDVTTEWQEQ